VAIEYQVSFALWNWLMVRANVLGGQRVDVGVCCGLVVVVQTVSVLAHIDGFA
jgi:hypothetical protein